MNAQGQSVEQAQQAVSLLGQGWKNGKVEKESARPVLKGAVAFAPWIVGLIMTEAGKPEEEWMGVLYGRATCLVNNAQVTNSKAQELCPVNLDWGMISIGVPKKEIEAGGGLDKLIFGWFSAGAGQADLGWYDKLIPLDVVSPPIEKTIEPPVSDEVPQPAKNDVSFAPLKHTNKIRLFSRNWFWWIPILGRKI